MYPKHVGHENGGCGHLGGAPLSRPTFGGHSCKKDCMVAPHDSRKSAVFSWCVFGLKTPEFTSAGQLPAP